MSIDPIIVGTLCLLVLAVLAMALIFSIYRAFCTLQRNVRCRYGSFYGMLVLHTVGLGWPSSGQLN